MYQNELYSVLNTLKATEIRAFKLFLESPFHNNDQTAQWYYDQLLNKRGNLLKALPSDDQFIGDHIHSPFKTKKDIYNCRNRLLSLLEEYLLIRDYKDRSFQNQLDLARHYRQNGLRIRYLRAMRKAMKYLNATRIQDSKYLYQQFAYQQLDFEDPDKSIVRKDDRRIENVMLSLDQCYLAEKMKYATEMINRQQLLRTEYQEVIPANSLPRELKPSYPGILNLYLSVYSMLNQPGDEAAYHQFQNLLAQNGHLLSQEEKAGFYLYAINVSIRHLNQGRSEFIDHYLNLISRMEKDQVLLQDKVMNPWVFKNAVQLYLRKSQHEKAQQFLDKYKNNIPASHRESVVVLAQAQIAFATRHYEDIFSLTNQLRYLDYHLVVGLKLLACKAHLELENRVRLEGELEAFGKYLRYHTKELDADRVRLVENFIRMAKRINHLQPGDHKGLRSLHQNIQGKKNIAEKTWLLSFLEGKLQPKRAKDLHGR